jgi:hypothetical protein
MFKVMVESKQTYGNRVWDESVILLYNVDQEEADLFFII